MDNFLNSIFVELVLPIVGTILSALGIKYLNKLTHSLDIEIETAEQERFKNIITEKVLSIEEVGASKLKDGVGSIPKLALAMKAIREEVPGYITDSKIKDMIHSTITTLPNIGSTK